LPIALITDFGTGSVYAGIMRGVIAALAPDVAVVDLTHEIAPQAVEEAGFLLASSYRYFPEGTVFAAVVDPGVGTGREVVLLEASARRFLAPDNGLLGPVIDREPGATARHVRTRRLFLEPLSATFHGRDVFAPVAARLAAGLDPREVGPSVPLGSLARATGSAAPAAASSPSSPPPPPRPPRRVVHVDRFGNLVTDVPGALFSRLAALEVAGRRVECGARTYGEAPAGEPFFYVGSFDTVEVAVAGGDAARAFGAGRGAAVRVHEGPVRGALGAEPPEDEDRGSEP